MSTRYFVDPQDEKGNQFAGLWHDTLSDAIADAKNEVNESGVATVYVWEGFSTGNLDNELIHGIDPVFQIAAG